jgi:hypothetical protein
MAISKSMHVKSWKKSYREKKRRQEYAGITQDQLRRRRRYEKRKRLCNRAGSAAMKLARKEKSWDPMAWLYSIFEPTKKKPGAPKPH